MGTPTPQQNLVDAPKQGLQATTDAAAETVKTPPPEANQDGVLIVFVWSRVLNKK